MNYYQQIQNILAKIYQTGTVEESDIEIINEGINSDQKMSFQVGKNVINIGKGEGIHIGDRYYNNWNEEVEKHLICAIKYSESLDSLVRQKEEFYQEKRQDIINKMGEQISKLEINYENELRSLKYNYDSTLMKIENVHQSARSLEIPRIISNLEQQKKSVEEYLQSLEQEFRRLTFGGASNNGNGPSVSEDLTKYRKLLFELENKINSWRHSGASLPNNGPRIPDIDRNFENQKHQCDANFTADIRGLKLDLNRHKESIKSKANNDIQEIEKKGREEIYRFIVEFYLFCQEGYPFTQKSLNELKRFQVQLKMPKEEIKSIEASAIKPFYDKNLEQYEEEFKQIIEKETFPLSNETVDRLDERQESLGLRDEDIVSTEQPIIKPLYDKHLKEYKAEFEQIIKKEGYPLSNETITHLEYRRKSLRLKQIDVTSIQKPIIEILYHKNLDQYKKEFIDLISEKFNPLTKESLAQQRNRKNILGLQSQDTKAIEQKIIRQLYQKNLEKYEQEFTQKINQFGDSLDHKVQEVLRERQELLGIQLLGLESEDITTIKYIIENSKDKNRTIDYLSSELFREDYQQLRNLLHDNQWQKANEETKFILFKLVSKIKSKLEKKDLNNIKISEEQVRNIDILQIKTINFLWDIYSQGRFSFQKQKNIFVKADRDYNTFSQYVGWKKEYVGWKKKIFGLIDFLSWKSEAQIIYNIDAPEGHLPFWRLYIIDPENFINLIDTYFEN